MEIRRIADAPTLADKRRVELAVLKVRRRVESRAHASTEDEYGLARIDAMTAEVKAFYAALMRGDGGGDGGGDGEGEGEGED
jgi:hypothetical protein